MPEVKENIVIEKINKNAGVMEKCIEASIKLLINQTNNPDLDKFSDIMGQSPDFSKQFIVGVASNIGTKLYEQVVKELK